MPKVKSFNISAFVDESSSSIKPQNNYNTETDIPVAENNTEKRRGRKKSNRTIEKENGKVIFLEKEADKAMALISVMYGVDKQDIIRTALDDFLKRHFQNGYLDDGGKEMIHEYIRRTTKNI